MKTRLISWFPRMDSRLRGNDKKGGVILVFLALVAGLASVAGAAESGAERAVGISGYYKLFPVAGRSAFTDEGIYAVTNRLRLELKQDLNPWQWNLTLDNEAVVNDFSHTADFAAIRSRSHDRLAAVDLDKVSMDRDHLFLRHSAYRAFIKYYRPEFQAVVGKQAVDWGRLRFYSPFDIFNPLSATDLEPDERTGIDAVNLTFSPEALSGMNLVAAPAADEDQAGYGMKLYHTIATFDTAFIAANVHKDQTYGVAFDGYIKDAGLRVEITQTFPDNGRSFSRAGVGLDYTFSEKLYGLWEHFYNGGHDDNDASVFLTSYRASREIKSLNKFISSQWLKYDLTPLLHLHNYLIYDWEGQGVVVNPECQYNVTQNLDFRIGSQFFRGGANSEFGPYKDLYYLEVKWYF